jgi:HEAT repeat protein
MPETQVQEQIRFLRSGDPTDRLRAAAALGNFGAKVRETNETLASDYRGAVVSLADALRDQASPLIRAEAAWALGRIGGLAAMRRLLPRIEEVYPAPEAGAQILSRETSIQEEPASTRAALIAAAGRAMSAEEMKSLDERDVDSLTQICGSLLRQLPLETDDDVRVAIIETVVVLSMRARKAGLDIPTDFLQVLCSGDRDAVLAAIAVLGETAPDAREIVLRWHQRTGAPEPDPALDVLVDAWELQLADSCPTERSELFEWLDLAAVLWDLQMAVDLTA